MSERLTLLYVCMYGNIIIFVAAALNLFGKFLNYFTVSALFAVLALAGVATYKMMIKEQKEKEE
jgi:uncharacterized membrane protein